LEQQKQQLLSWAQHGQGWSLFGSSNHRTYFICWEGSTLLQGAYVQELDHSPHLPPLSRCSNAVCTTRVLPLYSTSFDRDTMTESRYRSTSSERMMSDVIAGQPGITVHEGREQQDDPRQSSSAIVQLPVIKELQQQSSLMNVNEEEKEEDCVDNYCDVLSPNTNKQNINGTNMSGTTPRRRRRNSEKLLQQCSSWTQLKNTRDNRIVLERQEPVLCLRTGTTNSQHYMLSLRQLVVDNGVASPFQQVLAWLSKRKNFFAATGIALDLLQDADTLFYLWKHAEMINEEDEETKLIGLLDGIIPVRILDESNGMAVTSSPSSVTAVHLSEMTVGCFIKGGGTMEKSLIRFLEQKKLYDPSRVALMLAVAAVNEIVDDDNTPEKAIVNRKKSRHDNSFDKLLWPVKCLLAVGTTRKYLPEALGLLNDTIPDELRHRVVHHENQDTKIEETSSKSESAPSMKLTKRLIELIVESDPLAIDTLMSFYDDESQGYYWQSLDHETCLTLSLMEVESYFPLLRHPEVRTWVRGQLDLCFQQQQQTPSSSLSTIWLRELCAACLHNADCNLNNLKIIVDDDNDNINEQSLLSSSFLGRSKNLRMDDSNCVFKQKIERTRNALLPTADGNYSLDHDLLVPTLLLLEYRNTHWYPSTATSSVMTNYVSSQSLLDAACYQAGRTTTTSVSRSMRDRSTNDEVFLFPLFDSKSAMKQCFQANNMLAGAHLIGGTDGFILHLCYILTDALGISTTDAESFLVDDELDLQVVEESKTEMSSFELTSKHQTLLLLLDEHVLSIKTFGDFDSVYNRGSVDPVFAARSVLRAWLSLSYGDKNTSTSWLGDWLARRLEIRRCSSSFTTPTPTPNTTTFVETDRDKGIHDEDVNASELNNSVPVARAASPAGVPPPLPPSTDVEAIDDDYISKGATTTTAAFLSPSQVYLNEITSKYTAITTNSDNANSGATSSSGTPPPSKAVRHRLACASLVRSLLWPNNNATSKDTTTGHDDSKDDSEVSSVPLAVAMKFEKKLLIELCQSCLGLVESVPPNVMDAINVQ